VPTPTLKAWCLLIHAEATLSLSTSNARRNELRGIYRKTQTPMHLAHTRATAEDAGAVRGGGHLGLPLLRFWAYPQVRVTQNAYCSSTSRAGLTTRATTSMVNTRSLEGDRPSFYFGGHFLKKQMAPRRTRVARVRACAPRRLTTAIGVRISTPAVPRGGGPLRCIWRLTNPPTVKDGTPRAGRLYVTSKFASTLGGQS